MVPGPRENGEVTARAGGSGRMEYDIEALARSRRNEIAREQIVILFADLVWVLAVRVSSPKPLLADRVRNIQDMELVCDVGLGYQ